MTSDWTRQFIGDRLESTSGKSRARLLALGAAFGLIGAIVAVLYHITDVVGGTRWLGLTVALAILAGVAGAKLFSERTAMIVGTILLLAGLGVYLSVVPRVYLSLVTVERLITDLPVLFTGFSMIQIVRADIWAITIAPTPVFLILYLALRRRYDLSAWVGGLTLGFFVLTGDASTAVTLVGVASALAQIGFGGVETTDLSARKLQDIGLLVALAIVLGRFVKVVPSQTPGGVAGVGAGEPTLEGSLVAAGDTVSILGSISLTPTIRFTVEADQPSLWHAGAYDRYTGGRWVRSGQSQRYRDSLEVPPGETETVRQRFTVESPTMTMPAAWRPRRLIEPPPTGVQVTTSGDLQPKQTLNDGHEYRVTSEVPDQRREVLQAAGTDYPDSIEDRYLQVPASTPARVGRRAAQLTSNAETPYEAAMILETWLESNKGYSLDIDRPQGDIVDQFLFEMKAGYCVYFASAMVVMLRTLGVPARFAVGYSQGNPTGEQQWVIRGYHSHAWVDVYFPDVGWVSFDPTPAGPRREAERARLQEAGGEPEQARDTTRTATGTPTPESEPTSTSGGTDARTDTSDTVVGADLRTPNAGAVSTPAGTGTPADAASESLDAPIPETARGRLTVIAGAVALALGVNRLQLFGRGYREFRLRHQTATDNTSADVERAFERLEVLLSRRYRERETGETPRSYMASLGTNGIDARAYRVGELYEQARYGSGVSRAEADEAIALVDELVSEQGVLQ